MIRRQEAQGRRIPDTKAAFDFLSDYAKSSGTKKGGPFADWSPYKITRYHVKLVGVKEIPRPPVNLEGIPGSSRLYQFMGGVDQEMCPVVECGMVHAESANNNEALLVGERVITARPYEEDSRPWRIPSTVKREWKIQVRQASCYCSACRVHDFSACKVESVYPGLVGAVKREVVKEKASLTSVGAQTD